MARWSFGLAPGVAVFRVFLALWAERNVATVSAVPEVA